MATIAGLKIVWVAALLFGVAVELSQTAFVLAVRYVGWIAFRRVLRSLLVRFQVRRTVWVRPASDLLDCVSCTGIR